MTTQSSTESEQATQVQPGQPDFSIPSVDMLAKQGARLGLGEEYTVDVRDTTPFLPKVAFVTITLASIAGAIFTGRNFGLDFGLQIVRWLILWTMALSLGFSAWRTIYLHARERGLDEVEISALEAASVKHARPITRFLAVLATVSTLAITTIPYLDSGERIALMSAMGLTAVLLWVGVAQRWTAGLILVGSIIQAVLWGAFDAVGTTAVTVRALHFVAFGLWLGGALWNLTVAIPSGRDHPVIDSVVGLARQLQRFRWVVRFALPTVIITGLIQTDVYRQMPSSWWTSLPGVLIPVKVLLIIALIVIFITCPLYRQCSPVKGVCKVDDLVDSSGN
ncbi:MAG: hypothetical protein M5U23_13320 [Acidimicrobiia bacterium]|nr:hypothetical protein [Acidimicrobiia bacterium]